MYSDWIRQVEGKTDDRVRETEEPWQRVHQGDEGVPSGYILDEYYSLQDLASRVPSSFRFGDYRNGGQVGVYGEPAEWTSGPISSESSRSNSPSEPEEAVPTITPSTVTVSGTNYRVQYGRDEDGRRYVEYTPISGEDSDTQSG